MWFFKALIARAGNICYLGWQILANHGKGYADLEEKLTDRLIGQGSLPP